MRSWLNDRSCATALDHRCLKRPCCDEQRCIGGTFMVPASRRLATPAFLVRVHSVHPRPGRGITCGTTVEGRDHLRTMASGSAGKIKKASRSFNRFCLERVAPGCWRGLDCPFVGSGSRGRVVLSFWLPMSLGRVGYYLRPRPESENSLLRPITSSKPLQSEHWGTPTASFFTPNLMFG